MNSERTLFTLVATICAIPWIILGPPSGHVAPFWAVPSLTMTLYFAPLALSIRKDD